MESLAELVRFTEDAFGFRYVNHVAMFIVTDEGVVLTDPIGQQNPRTPYLIKEAIRSVTDQPVKYVVYSHSAPDHSTGGAVFSDTAQFVGHRNAAEKMSAAGDPASPPPEITFDKQLTLELGGKNIELYSADLSPTDDYIVLHHAASRLVMAVDFAQSRNIPFRTLLGDPDCIIKSLLWIHENLDFDLLVTGHSTPTMTSTKEDVLQQRQYYLDLSDAIAAARGAGGADNSPEMTAAVRSILEPLYGSWRRFDEFLALNVEGMLRWRVGTA